MSQPGVFEKVKAVMDRYGVPEFVWYPIALAESGLNALAQGDNGASIGVFQLNRMGGQGTGYTVEQLSDPTTNAEIAAQTIAPAYRALQGTVPVNQLAAEVARRSGHPGGSLSAPLSAANSLVQRIQALAQKFLSAMALPVTAPFQLSSQAGQAANQATQQATNSVLAPLQPIIDATKQLLDNIHLAGGPGILLGSIGLVLLVVVVIAMLRESKT